MYYNKIFLSLLLVSFLSSCASTHPQRDLRVSDDSEIFSNIEISKKITDRLHIQAESSIAKTKGNSVANGTVALPPTAPLLAIGDGVYGYRYYPSDDKVSIGDSEYATSKISYDYSVAHKIISAGYDVVQREHFGLNLALGISQYEYSAKVTMNGDVDVFTRGRATRPLNNNPGQTDPYTYSIPQGKVTDKKFNLDYTDYGLYMAVEPRYHLNKHYGASLRLATSIGEDSDFDTCFNSELSLRFNYKPADIMEIYAGFQYFLLGKDLDKDDDNPSTGGHKESNLRMNTRGLLVGVAWRL